MRAIGAAGAGSHQVKRFRYFSREVFKQHGTLTAPFVLHHKWEPVNDDIQKTPYHEPENTGDDVECVGR